MKTYLDFFDLGQNYHIITKKIDVSVMFGRS